MEADITSQAVGLASNTDFSLWKLFVRADIIVKSVIIILIACSVYSWAVIFEKIKLFKKINYTSDAVDWLVLHQANQRILDSVGDRLKIPREKILSNLEKYGNTSAATIPLVMDEAIRKNRIKQNDIIATSGFGAGLSWGAALIKWG